MNKIVVFFQKHKVYFFCLFLSFFLLLIGSMNSPLYPMNTWVDVNAFFTVGKSMMRGVVPYRDLFEQKGPFLYLIYGIGSLISYKSFFGVFLIEILFFSATLYYAYRLCTLFTTHQNSLLILCIFACSVITNASFVEGGSCEEFCLAFLMITFYYFVRHLKQKELSKKEFYLIGFLAGLVFLMKYTILGFFLGVMVFFFFDMGWIQKRWKEYFFNCFSFLLGMFTPIVLFLIYFAYHHAVKEFFYCYIWINVTRYGESYPFLEHIIKTLSLGIMHLSLNYFSFFFFVILFFFFAFYKKEKRMKFAIFCTFCFTFIGQFFPCKTYNYYALPMLSFYLIPLCYIANCFLIKKITFKASFFVFFVCVICTYIGANQRTMIGVSKKELPQYQFASYIEQFENPTLLNILFLDSGFYTTTGIIPTTYFFEVQNIEYSKFPENLDSISESLEREEVDFAACNLYVYDFNKLIRRYPQLAEHYDLVLQSTYQVEKDVTYNFYLFQRKGISS